MTTLQDYLRDLQIETLRKAKEAKIDLQTYDIKDNIDNEIFAEQLDITLYIIKSRLIGGEV